MPSWSRRRSLSASDGFLSLFFAACVFGFVRSQAWPGAWLLWLPALLALGLVFDGVSDRMRRRGERDAWLLVGLAGILGVGWTLYAFVGETLIALLRGVIGSGLVLLAATFLAGQRVWRPQRGLIPAGLGALVVAGLDPYARMTLPTLVAAIGLCGWVVLDNPTRRRPGVTQRRRWAPLILSGTLAISLAVGFVLLLPWAQPFAERAAAKLMSGSSAGVGLSDTAQLGAFEKLALSREVVLRLWADQPMKLRAHVLTEFDGRRWTAPHSAPQALAPATSEPGGALGERIARIPGTTFQAGGAAGVGAKWARFLLAQLDRGQLVAPRGPQLVRIAGGTPLMNGAGILSAPFWPPPQIYGVVYAVPARVPLTPEARAAALQLPEGLDPRLAALSREIAQSAASDPARLDHTLAWIGRECRYSLDVGPFHSNQPVAEFLFEKKRGYCEYFASGAAILLRLQGIPTRYVSGLSVRDENRRGDHYLVRASDAHAWVEVWLEGVGWVEADPTPSAQYDAIRAGMKDGWFGRAWEAVSAFFAELSTRLSLDWKDALRWLGRELAALADWLSQRPGLVLAAVLVFAGGRWGRRLVGRLRRRPRVATPIVVPEAVGPQLAGVMKSLERRWSELGHPRPAHRAPLEHLAALPEGALPPALRATSRDIVDCYYRARFGGRPPGPAELGRLGSAVKERATRPISG